MGSPQGARLSRDDCSGPPLRARRAAADQATAQEARVRGRFCWPGTKSRRRLEYENPRSDPRTTPGASPGTGAESQALAVATSPPPRPPQPAVLLALLSLRQDHTTTPCL